MNYPAEEKKGFLSRNKFPNCTDFCRSRVNKSKKAKTLKKILISASISVLPLLLHITACIPASG